MDSLLRFDSFLTLLINGAHSPFFDQVFFNISEKWMWIPLYVAILFVFFRKEGKQAWWFFLSLIIVVLLSDQISSSLLKPLVERFRPSHDPLLLSQIHLVKAYTGGLYGFASSHAANTAGMALFLSLLFKNRIVSACLAFWVLMTAYSRVYLGVHFVGDVVCGALIGMASAYAIYSAFQKINQRYVFRSKHIIYSSKDILPIVLIITLTFVFVVMKQI
ncbi:MAG: phosphatase PAP2 family protein [Bacteroidales bacterium]